MQRKIAAIVAGWFIAIITLTPVAQAATQYNNYVAMGDSVASGAGLSSAGGLCDRSALAYPYRVAARLDTSVTQLACSGATINDGIYGDQERNGTSIPSQIDQAFANGKPDVITMTIGANDSLWQRFLQKCQIATCGTTFDNWTAKTLRGEMRVELYWALYRIDQLSGGNPPLVLLNSYYAPFNNTVCAGTEQITPTERMWVNARTADLNQAINSLTPWFSNTRFVSVSFTGHELCSTDPWVQSMSGRMPLHPTATGQIVIANANLRALGR